MDRRAGWRVGRGLVGHINLKSLLHNSSKKSRGFWVNLPQMNFISWLKVKRVIKYRRIPVERWRWRTVRGALPPPKAGGEGRRIRWRFPPAAAAAAATGIKDGEGKDGTATLTDFSALRERSATPADLPADWFQRVAEDGAEEWDSKHYVRRARCHHTLWLSSPQRTGSLSKPGGQSGCSLGPGRIPIGCFLK